MDRLTDKEFVSSFMLRQDLVLDLLARNSGMIVILAKQSLEIEITELSRQARSRKISRRKVVER